MKKKLALLMAAIMTVAMVPMTAFATTSGSTSISADNMRVAVGDDFQSNVEIYKKSSGSDATANFVVEITLENGTFSTFGKDWGGNDTSDYKDDYVNEFSTWSSAHDETKAIYSTDGIAAFDVTSDNTAVVTIKYSNYNNSDDEDSPIIIPIVAKADSVGEVIATFESTVSPMFTMSEVIATASEGGISISLAGVRTFVEDQKLAYNDIKTITIKEVAIGALDEDNQITVSLKGNYVLNEDQVALVTSGDGGYTINDKNGLFPNISLTINEDDEFVINLETRNTNSDGRTAYIVIEGLDIKPTKSCSAGNVATLSFKSKDFDTIKLDVAKMVEEAVTYSVDDDDLPRLWAGQLPANNEDNEGESLTVYIEENTGDILNTSRKATFTFPDGIEVAGINVDGVVINSTYKLLEGKTYSSSDYYFEYEIDENVVTIWNYGEEKESNATDMEISFILSAAPTFEGDVTVTLGGEFDDVEFTVATVEAPYTVEAKTSEVLIDYRYVPVNEIIITEAEAGLLVDDAVIYLEVEKMDFEDAGTYEVTEGDIEVDVEIESGESDVAQLKIIVDDSSTEASTIVISGLELYLDRTLPVGGYALKNVMSFGDPATGTNSDYSTYGLETSEVVNILWENSADEEGQANDNNEQLVTKTITDPTDEDAMMYDTNGIFKYSAVTVNDSYVEVVTAARDQDDSTTSRKIVITIGATTMSVGTETITLDAPAYINSEDYTMLPVRAISEAFGATVTWDDASKTVTVLSGQRIISMTIGSKTMYINGTPVAMNTAAEITNDRTFIPVRDLANSLGISAIDWNEASATVTLN